MIKFFQIGILVILLMMVRTFQEALFYDPFVMYFKRFVSDSTLPEFHSIKLILHVFLRYVLNTVISIGLLYVVFKRSDIVKFSMMFYGVSFVILIVIFTFLLQSLTSENVMPFFYVRRFLIHPIFILLLFPAFYYQQILQKT